MGKEKEKKKMMKKDRNKEKRGRAAQIQTMAGICHALDPINCA